MATDRRFRLPPALRSVAGKPGGSAWLKALPATVAALANKWSLSVGEPFMPGGQSAWVAPVRMASGDEAVLKVGWPHFEAEHELEGLQLWQGDGAVQVFAGEVFQGSVALLLERCKPGTSLGPLPMEEQDEVIAGLLLRLWREPPPGHPFRPLAEMCDQWPGSYERRATEGSAAVLDPGLAREALAVFRSLAQSGNTVLVTDLHAGNVLAAEREPWLMIDPKPYVGDPAYDVLQHMLNCKGRLRSDPAGLARRMANLARLDEDRVLLWLFARAVQESPNWPYLAEVAKAVAPR